MSGPVLSGLCLAAGQTETDPGRAVAVLVVTRHTGSRSRQPSQASRTFLYIRTAGGPMCPGFGTSHAAAKAPIIARPHRRETSLTDRPVTATGAQDVSLHGRQTSGRATRPRTRHLPPLVGPCPQSCVAQLRQGQSGAARGWLLPSPTTTADAEAAPGRCGMTSASGMAFGHPAAAADNLFL